MGSSVHEDETIQVFQRRCPVAAPFEVQPQVGHAVLTGPPGTRLLGTRGGIVGTPERIVIIGSGPFPCTEPAIGAERDVRRHRGTVKRAAITSNEDQALTRQPVSPPLMLETRFRRYHRKAAQQRQGPWLQDRPLARGSKPYGVYGPPGGTGSEAEGEPHEVSWRVLPAEQVEIACCVRKARRSIEAGLGIRQEQSLFDDVGAAIETGFRYRNREV